VSKSDDLSLAASAAPATEIAVGEACTGSPITVPAGPAMPTALGAGAALTGERSVAPTAEGLPGEGVRAVPAVLDDSAGSLRRRVLILAMPVLGEQVLNTFVAWNDTYLAGHLNVSATAAVGFSAYVSWLIAMLFGLVGTGATAIVARAIGAGDRDEARRATNQAIVLSMFMGLMATACIPLAAPYLAGWFHPSAETHRDATRFMRIESIAYLIESFTFIAAACLRGAGDTRTPMLVLGVVNIVNMIVSWFCAFSTAAVPSWMRSMGVESIGLGLGCDGIAWGTATARFAGGFIMLAVMLRGRANLQIVRAYLRPVPGMLKRIIRIGGPAAIDGALMWCCHLVFLRIIARSGEAIGVSTDTMVAAHIVGVRIESLSYLPALAWSTAAATLVGQYLGAGRPAQSTRSGHEAAKQAALVLSFMTLVYLIFPTQCYGFLTGDAEVVRVGAPALRIQALIQPALGLLIVYMGSLRGAGDTAFPMIITAIGLIGLRIPLSYLGGVVLRGGLVGAWVGMNVDLLVRAGLMTLRFRSGKWATKRV